MKEEMDRWIHALLLTLFVLLHYTAKSVFLFFEPVCGTDFRHLRQKFP